MAENDGRSDTNFGIMFEGQVSKSFSCFVLSYWRPGFPPLFARCSRSKKVSWWRHKHVSLRISKTCCHFCIRILLNDASKH